MSKTVFLRPFAFMTLATMALAATLIFCTVPSYAQSVRVKDLASVEGIRQNQLVGYGLVVGLNGTGDSLNNSPFTRQSLTAMLERLGVNTRGANLRTANVAAVMVTATREALSGINSVRLYGPADSAGIVSFTIEGVHPHDIGTILDEERVAIRAGHHCAQPLMEALGVEATARASFGVYNGPADVDALVRGIARVTRIFG